MENDILQLTAHFGALIGANWEELYQANPDSVELALSAIGLAEEFLALWECGALETLEDFDGSWVEHIDSYFAAHLAAIVGEKSVHQQMIDAGVPCHGHCSDLYVPCTPTTADILEKAGLLHTVSVSRFINQVEGGLWYDVAFQYDKNLETKN